MLGVGWLGGLDVRRRVGPAGVGSDGTTVYSLFARWKPGWGGRQKGERGGTGSAPHSTVYERVSVGERGRRTEAGRRENGQAGGTARQNGVIVPTSHPCGVRRRGACHFARFWRDFSVSLAQRAPSREAPCVCAHFIPLIPPGTAMLNHAAKPLFAWECLEDVPPSYAPSKTSSTALPDEVATGLMLIDGPRAARGNGRDDYHPVAVLWGVVLL